MESSSMKFYVLRPNTTATYCKHVTYLILVKYSFHFKKYEVWMGSRNLEGMSMIVDQYYSIKQN